MMAKGRRTQHLVKFEDVEGFLEEFQEETDRAAAVLGAAYLDECLRQLIASFLIDDPTKVDELLGPLAPLAPLGSLASRISASYCMGLVSEDEYHDLQIIREIRNAFAHELHGLSFSDRWIRDKCAELQPPKIMLPRPDGPSDARTQFMLTVALLALLLGLRTLQQQKKQRRVVPGGFKVVETVD